MSQGEAQDSVELGEVQGGDLGMKEEDVSGTRGGPQDVAYH